MHVSNCQQQKAARSRQYSLYPIWFKTTDETNSTITVFWKSTKNWLRCPLKWAGHGALSLFRAACALGRSSLWSLYGREEMLKQFLKVILVHFYYSVTTEFNRSSDVRRADLERSNQLEHTGKLVLTGLAWTLCLQKW